jgi:hypothetical protein
MKLRKMILSRIALLVCAVLLSPAVAAAQHNPGGGNFQRDPFFSLENALAVAGAPALTTAEQTQLTTLITTYRNSLPTTTDATLAAARTAFNTAVLNGDLATAKTQAGIIATREEALNLAQLQALATFEMGVVSLLTSGGQLAPLRTKFGDTFTLDIISSFAGDGPLPGGKGRLSTTHVVIPD